MNFQVRLTACAPMVGTMEAWARYHSGEEVKVGDRVSVAGSPPRTISALFSPDHEISLLYGMEKGCIEILPATIESNPLDEDILLLGREGSPTLK